MTSLEILEFVRIALPYPDQIKSPTFYDHRCPSAVRFEWRGIRFNVAYSTTKTKEPFYVSQIESIFETSSAASIILQTLLNNALHIVKQKGLNFYTDNTR